ncbi:Uncharacterized protein Rs2_37964 [Raphanus sativus]|nr:Uncharacterized protein Rs2_37964 [Raphanus sativus]
MASTIPNRAISCCRSFRTFKRRLLTICLCWKEDYGAVCGRLKLLLNSGTFSGVYFQEPWLSNNSSVQEEFRLIRPVLYVEKLPNLSVICYSIVQGLVKCGIGPNFPSHRQASH